MKYAKLGALAFVIWAYGSEPLDILMSQSEWTWFSQTLRCEARGENVWCEDGGKWYTIDNKPLPVPWGIE